MPNWTNRDDVCRGCNEEKDKTDIPLSGTTTAPLSAATTGIFVFPEDWQKGEGFCVGAEFPNCFTCAFWSSCPLSGDKETYHTCHPIEQNPPPGTIVPFKDTIAFDYGVTYHLTKWSALRELAGQILYCIKKMFCILFRRV
jgi:hypothetical protein